MIHAYHQWSSIVIEKLWTFAVYHEDPIINKTPFLSLIYTSTATQMFRKTKVDYNPQHWQPIFCPVYALACTLSVDQPFDKCKEKNTTGIYLGIFPIHGRTSYLVLILTAGRVTPQFHIEFYTYLTTINVSNGNIVPPRYWQAMYGFLKGNNLAFTHYEKHNPPTALFLRQIKIALTIRMSCNQRKNQ